MGQPGARGHHPHTDLYAWPRSPSESSCPGRRHANGLSIDLEISADGRLVAFISAASNLVRGADTNAGFDALVRDRLADIAPRASVGEGGQAGQRSQRQRLPHVRAGPLR